jgi:hypothetical protein
MAEVENSAEIQNSTEPEEKNSPPAVGFLQRFAPRSGRNTKIIATIGGAIVGLIMMFVLLAIFGTIGKFSF